MAILGKVDKMHDALVWHGEIPLSSRYSAGIAGEKFFRTIKDEGRFLGTHCPTCDLTYVPARMFCERCFSDLDQWVDVANRGQVFTFTVLHRDLDDKPLEKPVILAYIKLDEANGGLVHFLGDVDADDVEIGLSVAAVFKPPTEREGSILDIVHFHPVKG